MRSEKGITLTSLVTYVLGITIIISIITIMSTYFYKNIKIVNDSGKNSEKYTAFNMFFLQDIKNEKITIAECTGDKIIFSNGVNYQYYKNRIYRNGVEILNGIELLNFKTKKDDSGKKDIITVSIAISGNRKLTKSVDYVLRYW